MLTMVTHARGRAESSVVEPPVSFNWSKPGLSLGFLGEAVNISSEWKLRYSIDLNIW